MLEIKRNCNNFYHELYVLKKQTEREVLYRIYPNNPLGLALKIQATSVSIRIGVAEINVASLNVIF